MVFRLMIKSLNVGTRIFLSSYQMKYHFLRYSSDLPLILVPKYVLFYLDRKPLFCTVFPLSFYCNLLAFAWLMISFEIFHEALAQLGRYSKILDIWFWYYNVYFVMLCILVILPIAILEFRIYLFMYLYCSMFIP